MAERPRRQAHPPSLPGRAAQEARAQSGRSGAVLVAAAVTAAAVVAVLNGTTVTGLARAEKLTILGFREGVVTNDTTNQNRRRTLIYYERGYREQAQAVAACIEVGVNRVHPMNANARVAGDRAEIVVFVGADKAR